MKKTILFLFLFSIGLFCSFEAIASGGYTHKTPNLELKPISSLDKSYQTAAVCFLGVGDCDPNVGHSTGNDNMDTDGAKQCLNAGFTRKTCNAVQDPIKDCVHDKNFVTGCKCKTNLVTCTSPKFGVGLACGGKYASCQCPATVSMSYPNDRCTKTCDGNCITKTCTKTANESGCRYGTQSCSDGCGGNTRSCCRPCSPASNETGCSYGTQSCSDGCGGTRQCCKTVPPCNSSHPSWCRSCRTCHGDCCSDGTFKSCDTRCGGSGCYTPPPSSGGSSSGGGSSGGGDTCSGSRYVTLPGSPHGCGSYGGGWIVTQTSTSEECRCGSNTKSLSTRDGYDCNRGNFSNYTTCQSNVSGSCPSGTFNVGSCSCC